MKIADSSCLVCVFTEINRPFLLMEWIPRGHEIIITQEVFLELSQNLNTKKNVEPYIKKGYIKVKNNITKSELDRFRTRHPQLGLGECSVIITALKYNEKNIKYFAVIDDGYARKVAKNLQVNLTGTIGLLKNLRDKQIITQEVFEKTKEELQKSNFRFDFSKLQ